MRTRCPQCGEFDEVVHYMPEDIFFCERCRFAFEPVPLEDELDDTFDEA